MKRFFLLFASYILWVTATKAQLADSNVIAAVDDEKVSFSALLPPLRQIPGAPTPFYTYLWDFGDGHFSTQANPTHIYKNAGTYDCYLYAVNNYDDGKKPQRKKQKIQVANPASKRMLASVDEQDFFKANGLFELKYNCMAKPNDTMVLIAGWKNVEMLAGTGKLYLLFNEKQFEHNCFDTADFRAFNNENLQLAHNTFNQALLLNNSLVITESGSPPSNIVKTVEDREALSLLTKTFALYKNSYEIDLGNIPAGEAKFSFMELYVTPQMIRDTNATLTITGLYLPDKGKAVMHKLNIPVVNSHDPNRMNIKGGRLSYRFLKKHKPLNYKVRFQNNGKGPARKIALDIAMADVLDPQTITVKDMSPYCPPCDSLAAEKRGCWEMVKTEKGAIFTFYGIYLPGTEQKGVENKDSTKGFMEFSIVTKKKLENKPFKSHTAIYFDNNDPIITNNATGRFKKSPSPVFMVGFEKAFGSNATTSDGIVTGVAIAPLAPYHPYFQFELYYKAGLRTNNVNVLMVDRPGVIVNRNQEQFPYKTYDSTQTNTISQVKFVPLHLRYNFNDYIAAGAGTTVTADVGGSVETQNTYYITTLNGSQVDPYISTNKEKVKAFSNWKISPFIDLQFGKVRLGPHAGFRYYYNGNKSSFGYFYMGWRL